MKYQIKLKIYYSEPIHNDKYISLIRYFNGYKMLGENDRYIVDL